MRFHHLAAAVALTATTSPTVAADKAGTKAETAPIALPAPPSGKGQIVFFRPGGAGFAIGCSVNEKGQKISSLGAGKYFIMVAEVVSHGVV